MDIKLISLNTKNFKGIRDFKLTVNGKNASVYGDNGTGKTSQLDAFLWTLFGKDSTGRSQFKVKPQDASGNDIHNLQTVVEAELMIDGKPVRIKKMQEEKWTKKRGSAEAELTGNTISYWWDEVPVKESEFKQRVSRIIDESIFRMITNPMCFNTMIPWQDRRKILIEICGNMSDADVIASDSKLSKLTEILDGKTIEDYTKILNERIKNLVKERDNIHPRINELMLQLPQEQPDYSGTEAELKRLQDVMSGIETELSDASKVAETLRRKQQELYALKNNIDAAKARIDKENGRDEIALYTEKQRLESSISLIDEEIKHLRFIIDQNNKSIKSKSAEREKLLAEWKNLCAQKAEVIAETFVAPDDDNFACPTCGQSLPDGAKEEKLAEMAKNFETTKKASLADIEALLSANKERGIALKSNTEALQTSNAGYIEAIQQKEMRLKEIKSRIAEIDNELSKDKSEPDYTADDEYASLSQQIEQLQAELSKPVEDTTSELLQKKREIQEQIDKCTKILNDRDAVEKTKKRIDELKSEEKRVAADITELEGHKHLIEQFNIQKVNLLESSINSRFKFVRFKLFDQQINGGINECCETLVNTNGSFVPFSEANHAGKVNAGLDIINTLCDYYGVRAPIFIDFRESVSRIIDTNSQIINLVKSEQDKTLRVEVEG